jgi:hypothetical protein
MQAILIAFAVISDRGSNSRSLGIGTSPFDNLGETLTRSSLMVARNFDSSVRNGLTLPSVAKPYCASGSSG